MRQNVEECTNESRIIIVTQNKANRTCRHAVMSVRGIADKLPEAINIPMAFAIMLHA
jgi:hypothetical protein